MDDEIPKATDKLQRINTESSSLDNALQSFDASQSSRSNAMTAMTGPSAIDRAIAAVTGPSAIDRAIAAVTGPSAIDKAIAAVTGPIAIYKAMAAMTGPLAIEKTMAAMTGSSVIYKAIAAVTGPLAMEKSMAAMTGSSAINKAMAAIANLSALNPAIQSRSANQVHLEHVLKGFANASSVILTEPSYLSDMAEIVSRIDLDSVDLASIEREFENTESEFASIENRANFVSIFSSLPPSIQAILFYFLIHIFLPQINSISANLLTPLVDNYLQANVKSDRQKIKEIKNIPLSLMDVNTDDLRFITGNNVHLRARPSTNSQIYDELVLGQVVTVLSKQKNWIEVMYSYDDGKTMSGWVFTRYTAKFIK
ncbi:MAG TPA: SH3 domain-containing protein [Rheinheimera sp.]|uniref:SH3 domain-containing protein n=1 Tax=Rheinheimera sp. TaxID=1869214 RepID=UPI002B479BB6|nr:SH3 domain-containing protein [Rheinheimera sp.]HJS15911.1 SH3 domain-containing protein [Rheinheimera sp.]